MDWNESIQSVCIHMAKRDLLVRPLSESCIEIYLILLYPELRYIICIIINMALQEETKYILLSIPLYDKEYEFHGSLIWSNTNTHHNQREKTLKNMNDLLLALRKYNRTAEQNLIGEELIIPRLGQHEHFEPEYLLQVLFSKPHQELEKDLFEMGKDFTVDKSANYRASNENITRAMGSVNHHLRKLED